VGALITNPAARATALFYAALFMAIGAHMPFWPIWLADWGLSEAEIGFFLALGMVVRPVTGVLAPWIADLTGRRRTALVLLALLAFATFALHAIVQTRPMLMLLTVASMVMLPTCVPIGDALSVASGRRHGFEYGPVRAVGSAAFLLANLGCGWALGIWGSNAALVWVLVCVLALAWFSHRHPGGARDGDDPRPDLAAMARLIRAPAFRWAAVASASLQAAHAPLYAYGSIDWRLMGIAEGTIGALWAISVAAEIAFMLSLGALATARLGPAGLFVLSGVAGLPRWLLMMSGPALPWLWFVQMLHAFTFAAALLGLIAFVGRAVPSNMAASAQGLAGAGFGGLAMAAGTMVAAALHGPLGHGIHGVGFVLTLVGLWAAWRLSRVWDGGAL
jgi:PPP family 3-phenylpropionic acid transporter